MNQNFVAGLGNIYCSEILFDARVNPNKICKNLDNTQIKKILRKYNNNILYMNIILMQKNLNKYICLNLNLLLSNKIK